MTLQNSIHLTGGAWLTREPIAGFETGSNQAFQQ
jgi:hypothetical protein